MKKIRYRKEIVLLKYIMLTAIAIISIFPFIWMISSSLKTNGQMFEFPIRWIPEDPQWTNYTEVWTKTAFIRAYVNTLIIACFATAGGLITSIFAAYAFAKLRFKGKNILFLLYLSVMMIPWHAIMVPQFVIMKRLGLMDSLAGLALLHSFNPFNVFLLRQFFCGIPAELSEAAKMDGASHFYILRAVIVPISKPVIASIVILSFLGEWNDYLGPLIYLSSENLATIQLALKTFQSQFSMNYVVVFAGTICSIVPTLILYIICQKYFTEGIAFSGIKG